MLWSHFHIEDLLVRATLENVYEIVWDVAILWPIRGLCGCYGVYVADVLRVCYGVYFPLLFVKVALCCRIALWAGSLNCRVKQGNEIRHLSPVVSD